MTYFALHSFYEAINCNIAE